VSDFRVESELVYVFSAVKRSTVREKDHHTCFKFYFFVLRHYL